MSEPRASLGIGGRRGIALLLACGVLVLLAVTEEHYPLRHWLLLRYARAAALALVFGGACLVAGHALLLRVLGRTLPWEEHASVAFALGLLAFFLISFTAGLAGLYGAPFFLLAPALLLAAGGRRFLATLERLVRHSRRVKLAPRVGPLELAALLFGAGGIGLLWFNLLTPRNASYDARWYHLPIAEHYVAQGGIAPFPEGWIPGAQPQLASLLYVWPFSMPGILFDRVETAAHMELLVFLMTLLGVSAIVRRVLGERAPLAWVALFLFPGIFCYDSGLVLGADHIAAVFAPPIFLLTLRFLERPTPAYGWLLGAAAAGALNTKYSAAPLVLLPVVAVLVRLIRDSRRDGRLRSRLGAAGALVAVVLFTTPHWLKNLGFYGDPLYPLLRHWLPVSIWSPAAEAPHQTWFKLWSPPLGLATLKEMVTTLFTFSFVPHDYPQYHGAVPVFGSLFTLFTPCLLFFRQRRRLLWLFLGAYLMIAGWFWIHTFDRYLQVAVPWMAAATAVVLTLVWRLGRVARAAAALAVGAQIAWGADVAFIPSHRAAGSAIQKVVVDLLGRGYHKDYAERLVAYPDWEAIGRALPPGAKVLVHEEEIHLGLSARSALDYSGDQAAFYWGEPGAASAAEIFRKLGAHGITHVVWAKNLDHATDTVAAGLAFFDFVTNHVELSGTFGGFSLGKLPASLPVDRPPGEVAFYPCETAPFSGTGLYRLTDLARAPGDRRPFAAPVADLTREQALERAEYLVFDARCQGPLPDETRKGFDLLAARGHAMLLVRRTRP